MTDITYKIRDFNEASAQIIIEILPYGVRSAVDLPIDDEGNIPTGEALDQYIQGFIPFDYFARLEKAGKGISNAGDLASLIEPDPEPEPEPEPEPQPPHQITMRQLIIGLATDEWITWPEAEAWADRSTLPAAVNAVIDQMSEEERPAARITAKTMSVAERDNPLLIGAAKLAEPEKSDEEIAEMIADAFTRWAEL